MTYVPLHVYTQSGIHALLTQCIVILLIIHFRTGVSSVHKCGVY